MILIGLVGYDSAAWPSKAFKPEAIARIAASVSFKAPDTGEADNRFVAFA